MSGVEIKKFPSCEVCPNLLPNPAQNCYVLRHNIPSDCPKDKWRVDTADKLKAMRKGIQSTKRSERLKYPTHPLDVIEPLLEALEE